MIRIVKKDEWDVKKELEKANFFEVEESKVSVIINDDIVVGFLYYSLDIENLEINLHVIEILEEFQRNGYGRDTVIELFKKYPTIKNIKGLSHPDAVAFWAKIGADFFDTCEECDYTACTEHPDFDESDWDDDEIGLGRCDDYSEDNFMLNRNYIIKKK